MESMFLANEMEKLKGLFISFRIQTKLLDPF